MNYREYKLQDKIEILKNSKSSYDVFQKLYDAITDGLEWKCERDTFEVDSICHCLYNEIITCLEVIEDLENYTMYKRDNNDIPENYQYIDQFWIEEDIEELV